MSIPTNNVNSNQPFTYLDRNENTPQEETTHNGRKYTKTTHGFTDDEKKCVETTSVLAGILTGAGFGAGLTSATGPGVVIGIIFGGIIGGIMAGGAANHMVDTGQCGKY